MRFGIGAVWIGTGVAVLHPHYREVGMGYLGELGLPESVMVVTCAAEVLLGLWVLARPMQPWLVAVQAGAILMFTAILAGLEPLLLAHPFGVLSKNVPILALLVAALLVQREGWSRRARRVLRWGMALIWITEGLLPKILFQQEVELAVVAGSGIVPFDAGTFLRALGVLQVATGIATLVLRGPALRVLLVAELIGLVVLPLSVSIQIPLLWVHPFGPMLKNIPILAGTHILLRRCSTWF
jgi:hypothetical protein